MPFLIFNGEYAKHGLSAHATKYDTKYQGNNCNNMDTYVGKLTVWIKRLKYMMLRGNGSNIFIFTTSEARLSPILIFGI